MFAIGEFARHARVSVRMLRHYDAIGLLAPACVDQATGYRSYEAGQLSRLTPPGWLRSKPGCWLLRAKLASRRRSS
jgi:DNA-binding transcriptional MerR regulator